MNLHHCCQLDPKNFCLEDFPVARRPARARVAGHECVDAEGPVRQREEEERSPRGPGNRTQHASGVEAAAGRELEGRRRNGGKMFSPDGSMHYK